MLVSKTLNVTPATINIAYKYIGESKGHKIKTGNAIAASLSSSSLVASNAAGNDSMRVLPLMDGHDTHIIGNVNQTHATATSSSVSNLFGANETQSLSLSDTSTSTGASDDVIAMKDRSIIENVNIDKCGASASRVIASNDPFQSFAQCDGVAKSIASSGEDNEVQASQVSVNHQNVLARMGKNLSFHSCEKIIINFK